ncbi:MAG: hypothetical protein M3Z04_04465 [Chloroflexota bacterium]|nr:hypothetical protein [Chloroflexota bacterium]
MSCPFAGLATRYTIDDTRVSVRICSAVPYERDSDPDDLPLPTVCFSMAAWQSCAHYIRLTGRKEIAQRLGLVEAEDPAADGDGAGELLPAVFDVSAGRVRSERRRTPARNGAG